MAETSLRPGAAEPPPPLIVNQGSAKIGELLAAHWSRPKILEHPKGAPGWDVPAEADVLITHAPPWRGAPKDPPPGWPHGLRFVQIMSAGVDPFPAWLFETVPTSCARGVAATPIAEFVIATILGHEKEFEAIRVRERAQWKMRPLGSLSGRCLGLAGFGAIGRAIAARALPFEMRILALRREARPLEAPIESAPDFASLIAAADHLVLALPLTAQTRRILDSRALAHAKKTLHVINVARGALVDEAALLAALDEGRIGGASLDVTDPEPPPEGHPFYSHPKVRLTPHISWGEVRATDRLAAKILKNLDHYVRGESLEDIVDPLRGY